MSRKTTQQPAATGTTAGQAAPEAEASGATASSSEGAGTSPSSPAADAGATESESPSAAGEGASQPAPSNDPPSEPSDPAPAEEPASAGNGEPDPTAALAELAEQEERLFEVEAKSKDGKPYMRGGVRWGSDFTTQSLTQAAAEECLADTTWLVVKSIDGIENPNL